MANYPLAVFHYKVSWNNQDIGFSDVSGLTQEIQPIEYRDGLMSGTTVSLKRPGLKKVNNISLKRGIDSNGNTSIPCWAYNIHVKVFYSGK